MTQSAKTAGAVEHALRTAVGRGQEADFRSDRWQAFAGNAQTGPIVQADLVRELVLHADAESGVRIRGATIDGLLDLRDARRVSGEPCNALILRDCALLGSPNWSGVEPGIDASHSHLQRLALCNCKTDGVELSSAVIVGDLDLDGLHPLAWGDIGAPRDDSGSVEGPVMQRACWVKACGVRVGGSLSGMRAVLSIPWQPGAEWPPAGAENWVDFRAPFGLDLQGAQIAGSLILQPGFKSIGGVNVAGATIGGDILAQGAHLRRAGVGRDSIEALRALSVEVTGHALFGCDPAAADDDSDGRLPRDDRPHDIDRPDSPLPEHGRFDARGTLYFYGARIGGALVLNGAKVTGAAADDRDDTALDLYSATLAADVLLGRDYDAAKRCEIPTMNLSTATIGGLLYIGGSAETPIERVDAAGLRIAGDLNLDGSLASTDLSSSIVDGQVVLGRYAPLALTSVNGRDAVLQFADARVGRELKVADVSTPRFPVTIDWTTSAAAGDDEEAPRLPLRVRTVRLASYPGWLLGEALFKPTTGSGLAILAFMYTPRDPADTLNGTRVVILDGRSEPIHELNDAELLEVGTAEQAVEYLIFFCAHVWGDEGAFTILPDTVDVRLEPSSRSWRASAHVAYGGRLFRADFRIDASGAVEMLDDDEIGGVAQPYWRQLYVPPVRWFDTDISDWPVPPSLRPEADWSEIRNLPRAVQGGPMLAAAVHGFLRLMQTLVQQQAELEPTKLQWPSEWKKPRVDLAGLKVASLDDGDGASWFEKGAVKSGLSSALTLELSGFEYDRITDRPPKEPSTTTSLEKDFPPPPHEVSLLPTLGQKAGLAARLLLRFLLSTVRHPRRALRSIGRDLRQFLGSLRHEAPRVSARMYWLKAQYERPPTAAEYRPQPYEHLARTWRAAGHFKAADAISYRKLRLERVLLLPDRDWTRWARFRQGLSQFGNFYFLQIPFGYGLKRWRAFAAFAAVWFVGVAVISAFPTVLKVDASAVSTVVSSDGTRVVVEEANVAASPEEIECGAQINKLIYPLDVMIPLIDLRQESRCHFSITERSWRVAKGFYAIIGWVVTSALILTLSGVVRRQIEG